jgi:hypothetical protein
VILSGRTFSLFPVLFILSACGSPGAPGEPQALVSANATGQVAAATTHRVAAPQVARVLIAPQPTAHAPRDQTQRSLRAVVASDPSPAKRRAAIDRLRSDAAGTDELLRSLNSDDDPVVRRWAALALERRAEPALAPALQQAAISESDPKVQHILERAIERARESA